MFENFTAFLWFFISGLLAIGAGVVCEEKLIKFENKIRRVFRAVIITCKEARTK